MIYNKFVTTKNKKQPMSAAERKCLQWQRQKEKDLDFQRKENEQVKLLRNVNRSKLSGSRLNELRKKTNETKDMQREEEKGTNRKRRETSS